MSTEGQTEPKELYYITTDGEQYLVKDIQAFESVSTGLFDMEEIHENCTVQILRNQSRVK